MNIIMYSLYLLYSEVSTICQWKIGVTNNINRRLNEIKTSNPNIIGFETIYKIEDRALAFGVESLLKKHLRLHTISGEWIYHEALNKELFLTLCEQYETSYKIHLEIEKNIKQKYDH